MRYLLLAAAVFLAVACGAPPQSITYPGPAATSFPASWVMPDHSLTPGALATTDVSRVCPHVDPALEAARPSPAEKAKVYQAYNLSYPQPFGKYELDHLVPIELGGAPDAGVANEWPEPNDTPDPAMIAKYHLDAAFIHNSKDIVEDVLHADVCAGKVSLATAQHAMATDWRAAYVQYVGPPEGS